MGILTYSQSLIRRYVPHLPYLVAFCRKLRFNTWSAQPLTPWTRQMPGKSSIADTWYPTESSLLVDYQTTVTCRTCTCGRLPTACRLWEPWRRLVSVWTGGP